MKKIFKIINIFFFTFLCAFSIAFSQTRAETSPKRKPKNNAARFPEYFKFGVATSSYQIEGAWNASGKSASIWDHGVHEHPSRIADLTNGDIACDSYHKIKDDIAMLKQLNVDSYRFSLSWTRLFPLGYATKANPDGVHYYKELISSLLENNIEPLVTLYHWDLPQILQDLNGWTNPILADVYLDYVDKVFELFGDQVKTWYTFNEPANHCVKGYRGVDAPFLTEEAIGTYLCVHTMLRAHGMAYKLYQEKYKASQNGKIAIVLDSNWYEPFIQDSQEDKDAVERYMQMYLGWTAHPIFSKDGDYPKIMRDKIDKISKIQGFSTSRLPTFTPEEIDTIRGSADFFCINHYTAKLISYSPDPISNTPSLLNDINATIGYDPSWEPTGLDIFKVTPFGLRKVLEWIVREYGSNIEISITENGYGGLQSEELNDIGRVNYLRAYLREVLEAIKEGINVTSYIYWSLMDNFEWAYGYSCRFGLYHVDFTNSNRTRTAKASAFVYRNVIRSRTVNDSYYPWEINSGSSTQQTHSNHFILNLILALLTLQQIFQ